MENEKKYRRDLRPDAQPFDEILIKTVPRYKESEMSGDEWRISALVQLKRKGLVVHEKVYGNIEYAAAFLPGLLATEGSGGSGFYAGVGNFCDQEGCASQATVSYKKKFDFCRSGHRSEQPSEAYRMFCEKHKSRGDCGLDDADVNYEAL